MTAFDPSRLYTTLLNTGLQSKDNPLYQVIHDLISTLTAVNKQVNTAAIPSVSTPVTSITQQIIGIPGEDGIDGIDGIPGSIGLQGLQGIQGIPGIDGDSFDEPIFPNRSISDLISSFTKGSVIFAGPSGFLAQNNASLFWDNTNLKLGIGTTVFDVNSKVHIIGTASTDRGMTYELTQSGGEAFIRCRESFAAGNVDTLLTSHATDSIGNNNMGITKASLSEIVFLNATNATIFTYGSGNLIFGTNSVERARFTSAGLFGLNIQPTVLFHMQQGYAQIDNSIGSGGTGAYSFIANSTDATIVTQNLFQHAINGSSSFIFRAVNVNFATARADLDVFMWNGSTYVSNMRIQSGGNVGIGTTGPLALLSIAEKFQVNSSGLVPKYNNISTISNGVPAEYATIDTIGLTANVATSTLYAVPASGAGMYRISAYVVETTAGSVSSTLPNVQVIYTDNDTGGSITIDATPILGIAGIGQTGALTANTIGTASSGVIPINVKASTTIQYQTVNYASNLAGMTYTLHIKLEAL